MSPGPHAFSSSPSKSIRTQIENAADYPEGYAERAKLVYQTADQEKWSREHTMEMLKDPSKFARFVEIVSYNSGLLLFRKNSRTHLPLKKCSLMSPFLTGSLTISRDAIIRNIRLKNKSSLILPLMGQLSEKTAAKEVQASSTLKTDSSREAQSNSSRTR